MFGWFNKEMQATIELQRETIATQQRAIEDLRESLTRSIATNGDLLKLTGEMQDALRERGAHVDKLVEDLRRLRLGAPADNPVLPDHRGPWYLGQTGSFEDGSKLIHICDQHMQPIFAAVNANDMAAAVIGQKIIDAHNDAIGYMDPKRAEATVSAASTPSA